MEEGQSVVDSLARLQTGEGWVWAPEFDLLERQMFPAITTFDSSRTPTEDDAILSPELAQVDAVELQALLGTDDAGSAAGAAGQPGDRAAVDAAFRAAHEEGRSQGLREAAAEIDRLRAVIQSVRSGIEQISSAVDGVVRDGPGGAAFPTGRASGRERVWQ